MSSASQAIADNPILRPRSIRCRSLTIAGCQCKANALRGQDLCVRHAKYGHPVLPRGRNVTIPLLEDLESLQVFGTQIIQGLLAKSIDPVRAGKILYACQIITHTLPRPPRLQPSQQQQTLPEPVSEVFESPDGRLLGPVEDIRTHARFHDIWSFDKYRYEEQCELLGRPLPQTPADMPESGWLSPRDLDSIDRQRAAGEVLLDDGYRDKLLHLRLAADRRGALPPLAERACMYGSESWCAGPAAEGQWQRACDCCARERDEYLRLHPEPEPEPTPTTTDLNASAAPDPPGAPHLRGVRRCGTGNSPARAPQPGLSEPKPSRTALPGSGGWVRAHSRHQTLGTGDWGLQTVNQTLGTSNRQPDTGNRPTPPWTPMSNR